jgi:hypothetical protein
MNISSFPKEFRSNLEWRREILVKAKGEPLFRETARELFHRDILFAFNAFFYTYDPRKRPFHDQPFCTWDFQDDAILDLKGAIELGEDRVYEKTRDMGASWILLSTMIWFWLKPTGGNDFLWGSRVEDYVDKKGDMRALFPKARYLIYRLPRWLLPKGFAPRSHDNYMKLINPATGSTISGESSNPNFSTGGRYLAVLFDEFAKWEADESAWTAAGDATPCRLANSTPFGAGGKLYQLATDGKTKKRVLHWKLHPEKSAGISCVWPPPNEDTKVALGEKWVPLEKLTSPWYEKECLRRSAKEIAQELDINYLGSGNPVFNGKAWDRLNMLRMLELEPLEFYAVDLVMGKLIKMDVEPLDWSGVLRIYRRPDSLCSYVIGLDPMEGTPDGDYDVLDVMERESESVAASYFSQVDEAQMAIVAKLVQEHYTTQREVEDLSGKKVLKTDAPWLGIETPGPGLATFDICMRMELPNLFLSPHYDSTSKNVTLSKGWRNSTTSRPELLAGLKEWLAYMKGTCHRRAVEEMMSMVNGPSGKPQAKSGCHDDEVFAWGICLQVHALAPWVNKLVEEIKYKTDTLLPAAFRLEPPKIRLEKLEEQCFAQALKRRDPLWLEEQFWEQR